MSETRPVLVVTSLIAHCPSEPVELDEFLDRICEDLRRRLKPIIESHYGLEYTGGFAFHYLGEEDENACQCCRCGRWATNWKMPNPISGLPYGDTTKGDFTCLECQDWLEMKQIDAGRT